MDGIVARAFGNALEALGGFVVSRAFTGPYWPVGEIVNVRGNVGEMFRIVGCPTDDGVRSQIRTDFFGRRVLLADMDTVRAHNRYKRIVVVQNECRRDGGA